MRMQRTYMFAAALTASMFGAPLATAQDVFVVTANTTAGAATFEVDGESFPLAARAQSVIDAEGELVVPSNQRIMLLHDIGVLVVGGPARLMMGDVLAEEFAIEIQSGAVMFVGDEALADFDVEFVLSGQDGGPALRVTAGPGTLYLARTATSAGVSHSGPAGLTVRINGDELSLAPGQALVREAGAQRTEPAGPWLARQGISPDFGRSLGLGSAQAARNQLEGNLLRNIVYWDRRASASYVVPRISAEPFSPEIRTVAQTNVRVLQGSERRAAIRTTPFAGANEIPPLSPAALTLGGSVGENVIATVIRNNQAAADLLGATGSQGLGFRGLSLLGVAGLRGGLPTIGPSGLGAGR